MDCINKSAYHKEYYARTQSKISLIKSLYFGTLAIIAALGHWLGKWTPYHRISKQQLQSQIKRDLELLPSKQIDRICQISARAFCGEASESQLASQLAASTYATTYSYFAPILYDWTLSLLTRARESGQHLVFMARDGKGAYLMAKKIQDQLGDPELSAVPISYVYLSRKVVHSDKSKLERYLRQELGLSNSKKFLFLDLGFLGSMVDRIRKTMRLAIPSAECEFEFLISTGDKARGFAGSKMKNLRAVRSAGKNPAVYWMEDTHQGTEKSPSAIVETASGRLVPNTVQGETEDLAVDIPPTNSIDALCRKTALRALVDFAEGQNHKLGFAQKGRSILLDENLRKGFDNWLSEVRQNRILYIEHT